VNGHKGERGGGIKQRYSYSGASDSRGKIVLSENEKKGGGSQRGEERYMESKPVRAGRMGLQEGREGTLAST